MSRVTLSTIAQKAGLSKYAVSRSLSGKSGVSETTRAHVRKVAATLGYIKPGTSLNRDIAALFDDSDPVNSELFLQIQTGFQREARSLGYTSRVVWCHSACELNSVARESAAMLVVGSALAPYLKDLPFTGKPVVRVGWPDPVEPIDLIGGTDHEAGSAVARLLLKHGHKEIVFVHGEVQLRGRMERLYGLREELESHNYVKHYDLHWTKSSSFRQALDTLLKSGGKPTAFFCAHDSLALTVITELLACGKRIPEDASIVGFGDYASARHVHPPLTTVKVFGEEFGIAAARLLNTRLKSTDSPSFPMRIQIPNLIIERSTVGQAPCYSISNRDLT